MVTQGGTLHGFPAMLGCFTLPHRIDPLATSQCHSQSGEKGTHWRYNLSSAYQADPDARLLPCLSQESLIHF
jgi:hypothetical protein